MSRTSKKYILKAPACLGNLGLETDTSIVTIFRGPLRSTTLGLLLDHKSYCSNSTNNAYEKSASVPGIALLNEYGILSYCINLNAMPKGEIRSILY